LYVLVIIIIIIVFLFLFTGIVERKSIARIESLKVKGRHLYTVTYRETQTSSGLQLKWRTDWQ